MHFNSRPHGGRRRSKRMEHGIRKFQLTPSRRATGIIASSSPSSFISTHALTEGDNFRMSEIRRPVYFNSRPHGGRLCLDCFFHDLIYVYFNSRPHGGRLLALFLLVVAYISTHALTEGDLIHPFTYHLISTYFNSRPHGGRPTRSGCTGTSSNFNSRPHGGRLPHPLELVVIQEISTHALTEGDYTRCSGNAVSRLFQLTPSRRATANLDKFFF